MQGGDKLVQEAVNHLLPGARQRPGQETQCEDVRTKRSTNWFLSYSSLNPLNYRPNPHPETVAEISEAVVLSSGRTVSQKLMSRVVLAILLLLILSFIKLESGLGEPEPHTEAGQY